MPVKYCCDTLSTAELLAGMQSKQPPGVAEILTNACVGIAGVGGLGSHVAIFLARSGIGKLIIADFDIIEPSNLNRQYYQINQLGQIKVAALSEQIAAITPVTTVVSHNKLVTAENVTDIFTNCQIIIECFDQASAKAMLVETVLSQMPQTTIIAASGVAGLGRADLLHTRQVNERLWIVGDEVSELTPGQGLMAYRVAVAAGQQAGLAIELLLQSAKQ